MRYENIFTTDFGAFLVRQEGEKITRLSILTDSRQSSKMTQIKSNIQTDLFLEAKRQLKEYFMGKRTEFDLPLDPENKTPFRQKVWEALLNIPYGETRSYRQIAESIGNISAARSVGNACGSNPILILIPCHRVIASNGSLGGFSSGLDLKRRLLNIENWSIE